jgi:hypothetical protein
MSKRTGVYDTIYGNTCIFYAGEKQARDIDMAEDIPLEAVNWNKVISFDVERYEVC